MNSGGLQIPRWKISSKKSHWKILSQSCELGRIQLSFGLKYSSWNQVGRFEKQLELKCAKPGRQVNDGEWAGPKTLGPKGIVAGFWDNLVPTFTDRDESERGHVTWVIWGVNRGQKDTGRNLGTNNWPKKMNLLKNGFFWVVFLGYRYTCIGYTT